MILVGKEIIGSFFLLFEFRKFGNKLKMIKYQFSSFSLKISINPSHLLTQNHPYFNFILFYLK